ncbi:transposable element Tcb2 transposase [Trichonephila clavipes]|nr:transposable element Tcb2 transposase [Trichonephila clavipes]
MLYLNFLRPVYLIHMVTSTIYRELKQNSFGSHLITLSPLLRWTISSQALCGKAIAIGNRSSKFQPRSIVANSGKGIWNQSPDAGRDLKWEIDSLDDPDQDKGTKLLNYCIVICAGEDLEPFLETGSAGRRPGQGCRWATAPNEDHYLVLTARRHRNMNATLLQQHLRSATGTTVSTQTVRNRLHGVVPYAAAIGDDFILMDDNCRPPRANLVEDLLFEEGIVRMEWPACFPDMDPIEHV